MTRVRKHLLKPRYAWSLLKPGIYSRLRKRREKPLDQKRCDPGCEKSFQSLWSSIALKQWAMCTDTFWWRLSARWSLLTKRKELVLSTIVRFNFHRYPQRSYRASADRSCDTALLVNMLALLRHLGCTRPDVERCPTERGASFLLKPSMKPMRAKSTSLQFSAALEHRETARRFAAEKSFGSKTECAHEVQLATLSNALPTSGGEISTIWSNACCWKLSWCTVFAIWTSWNVAGLLGGSPQSAILSSVSQRNAVGKVAKIVQRIVGGSGVDRGGASWVCVHILPSRPLELNRQKHSAQKIQSCLASQKIRVTWAVVNHRQVPAT